MEHLQCLHNALRIGFFNPFKTERNSVFLKLKVLKFCKKYSSITKKTCLMFTYSKSKRNQLS